MPLPDAGAPAIIMRRAARLVVSPPTGVKDADDCKAVLVGRTKAVDSGGKQCRYFSVELSFLIRAFLSSAVEYKSGTKARCRPILSFGREFNGGVDLATKASVSNRKARSNRAATAELGTDRMDSIVAATI